MTKYTMRIPGPAGQLEVVVNDPETTRSGIALIAHPHPLHGGTLHNKVAQTLAKTFTALNYISVRPNFRGVGKSQGMFDNGVGEVEDILTVANFAIKSLEPLPLLLAGFSFGAYVQAQAWHKLAAKKLILIAPAISLYDFPTLPPGTCIVHGEKDQLIPLDKIQAWANDRSLELVVIPGADHFFHRRLSQLQQAVTQLCQR